MTVSYRLVNRIKTFEMFSKSWGLAIIYNFTEYMDRMKEDGMLILPTPTTGWGESA